MDCNRIQISLVGVLEMIPEYERHCIKMIQRCIALDEDDIVEYFIENL